jgi:serine/threonine protein phosphatase 1
MNDYKSILHLPLDRSKRHLIVGDIHGRLKRFKKVLKAAKFNPDTDIIYSVGDLIDRGKRSYEVVQWFDETENAFVIKGNHEFMLEQASESAEMFVLWYRQGGEATKKSLDKNKISVIDFCNHLSKFPLCIEVGDSDDEGSFRILHADYPPEWSDAQLYQMLDVNHKNFFNRAKIFMWGRSTIKQVLGGKKSFKFNTERHRRTFLGHTKIHKVLQLGDLTWLDTGNVDKITIMDALTGDVFTS